MAVKHKAVKTLYTDKLNKELKTGDWVIRAMDDTVMFGVVLDDAYETTKRLKLKTYTIYHKYQTGALYAGNWTTGFINVPGRLVKTDVSAVPFAIVEKHKEDTK